VRILVVEDEPDLADAVADGLRAEGYAVDVSHEADAARERLTTNAYDLVTLDLGLGEEDGLAVCADLKAGRFEPNAETRVLVVTARDNLADRIAGLDEGADDYLVKPFAFGELSARIRALLRRDAGRGGAVIEIGDLQLDAARHQASRGPRDLGLTVKEFALLRYFMLHPSEVLSAEELLEHVWDENADPFSNVVRVTISNLRRKLAAGGEDHQPIDTVVGRGYRLVVGR
jgi:DNA-binding response OmpR family regulator